MKKLVLLSLIFSSVGYCQSQVTDPEITSWKLNTTGAWVYDTNNSDTILVDVESVWYDNSNVYVKASGVPSYYSFVNNNGNHNAAEDKHYVWKLTRAPQAAATPPSNLNGGQCGVMKDGTTFFNPEDARSYQNANIWHQLAWYFEGVDFDASWGHSSPFFEYHHHALDLAFVDTSIHNQHSPLIGYAFDGYPVYGPYGYTDANDTISAIIRMTPRWQKRNITQRTTLPGGTSLQASQYGPAIGGQYPLGCYREDYEFVVSSGTLDTHNGRFGKTPEFPNGVYAYFMTLDSLNAPLYPNAVGQTFYGAVPQGNMGPSGGQNTIPGTTTQYVPSTPTAIADETIAGLSFYPNPSDNFVTVKFPSSNFLGTIELSDVSGQILLQQNVGSQNEELNILNLSSGMYFIKVADNFSKTKWISRMMKL